MTNYAALENWVEDEYDPEEETPLAFVKGHEFPNPAAAAIALEHAQGIHRDSKRALDEEAIEEADALPVVLDTRADRLRDSSGRFIGWVEAAIKYIRKLGRKR